MEESPHRRSLAVYGGLKLHNFRGGDPHDQNLFLRCHPETVSP